MSDENDQILEDIYGDAPAPEPELHQEFAPWHKPVKQLVRDYQWGDALRRQIDAHRPDDGEIHYLTLPGPDLWDVRYLSSVCSEMNCTLRYLGFVQGAETTPGEVFPAEAALKQSERVSSESQILPDALESIAIDHSAAAQNLRRARKFHAINLDFCDHLTSSRGDGCAPNFDSLDALLLHQMGATHPWTLFITTRANESSLNEHVTALWDAIRENLGVPESPFPPTLFELVGEEEQNFEDLIADLKLDDTKKLIKLFAVGIGKYLLQKTHYQPNFHTSVTLISCYTYRVAGQHPDMLALAFRLRTGPAKLVERPGQPAPPEATQATQIASRLNEKLWDIDQAITDDPAVRDDAINGTKNLLRATNLSVDKWEAWLGAN